MDVMKCLTICYDAASPVNRKRNYFQQHWWHNVCTRGIQKVRRL